MSMNSDEQAGSLTHRRDPRIAGEARRANEARSTGEAAAQSSLHGPSPESARLGPRTPNGLEPSVELHIDELVLHGFEPAHRYAIGDAIERELTRLFTEQGAPTAITRDGETAHLDGGAFEISAGSNSETIGMELAKTIYGGLSL